jgi:hypothetical protein
MDPVPTLALPEIKSLGIVAPDRELQVPWAMTAASPLIQKLLIAEKAIEDLIAHIKDTRTKFDLSLWAASALSVERAMELLSASKSQVYRWTKLGKLKATWLDRHPRYRPADIQTFIDSRAPEGKPRTASKKPSPNGSSLMDRRKTGRLKPKNLKKRLS